MKKITLAALAFLAMLNVAALFDSFNYLEPEQFKEWLQSSKPLIIVDIQVADDFAVHHFVGSMETNAYPVKSDADRAKLDQAVHAFQEVGHDVVVVCPRGGGGAKRCYSYLKSQGVPEEKLTILKGGIDKWPYRAMLVSGR